MEGSLQNSYSEDNSLVEEGLNCWTYFLLSVLNYPWEGTAHFEIALNLTIGLVWSVLLLDHGYDLACVAFFSGFFGALLVVVNLSKYGKLLLMGVFAAFLCLGVFSVWTLGSFMVCFVVAFGVFLKVIRSKVSKHHKKLAGVITSSICLLIEGVMLVCVLFFKDFELRLVSVVVPVNLVTVLVWVCIQLCCFVKYPSNTELLKKRILENEDPFSLELLNRYPEILQEKQDFGENINKVSGCLVGVILIAIQVFSWWMIYDHLQEKGQTQLLESLQDEGIRIYLFYVIGTPLFGYLGVMYSAWEAKKESKILWAVVIFSLFLVPVLYSKYNLVEVGYPISLAFWVLMAMVYEQNKRVYQFTTMMSFTGFLLPLGVLYPLNMEEIIDDLVFVCLNTVLVLCTVLVTIFFLAKSISMEIRKKLVIVLLKLKVFLGSDFADFIYTIGYIIGCWVLAYGLFQPEYEEDALLVGCLVVMVYSVVLSMKTQNLVLYLKEPSVPELPLKQTILNKQENRTKTQLENFKKKKTTQKKLLLWFVSATGIAGAIEGLSLFEEGTFLVVLTGSFIASLFFLLLVEVKFLLRQHGKPITSYLLSLWWVFVNIPFACLIPFYITEKNQESLATLAIGLFFVLVMLFISTISITLNILFKRMEYDKVARYCCAYLQRELSRRRVKCESSTLRVVFDKFAASEFEVFEKLLLEKTIVDYLDLAVNEVDLNFAKKLVVTKNVKKLKAKLEKETRRRTRKISTLSSKTMKNKSKIRGIYCIAFINFFRRKTSKRKTAPEKTKVKKQTYKEKYNPNMSIPNNSDGEIMDFPEVIESSIPSCELRKDFYERFEWLKKSQELEPQQELLESSPKSISIHSKLKSSSRRESAREEEPEKELVNNPWGAIKKPVETLTFEVPEKKKTPKPTYEVVSRRVQKEQINLADFKEAKKELENNYRIEYLKRNFKAQRMIYQDVFNKKLSNEGRTMTLWNLRNFADQCKLKKKIGLQLIDLQFTSATKKVGAGALDFNLFYKYIVPWISKQAYGKNVSEEEANKRFFIEYIFEKFVENKKEIIQMVELPKAQYNQFRTLPKAPVGLSELLNFSLVKKPLEGISCRIIDVTKHQVMQKPLYNKHQHMVFHAINLPKVEPFRVEEERIPSDIASLGSVRQEEETDWNQIYFLESNLSEVEYDTDSEHSFEIIEPEYNKIKFLLLKASDFVLDKFSKCFNSVLKCMEWVFLKIVNFFAVNTDKLEKKLEALEQENERISLTAQLPCPDWENLCNVLSEKIKFYKKEAEKAIKANLIFEIRPNMSNLFAIANHIIEIFIYTWVGFKFDREETNQNSFANFNLTVDWKYTFWVSSGLGLALAVLVTLSLKYLKKGTLGINPKDGTDASFPSLQFFLSKLCQLLGKSMYFTIICSLLSALACDFSESEDKLIANEEIKCFSEDHSLYFSASLLLFLIYYPLATLLYPNVQYQDRALDIKFDSTFLVLESQGKLLIASFGVFFTEEWAWMKLSVMATVFVCLFILSLKMQPCICQSYNVIKTGAYLVPAWVCGCSVLSIVFEDYDKKTSEFIRLFVSIGGIAVLIVFIGTFQVKNFGWKCVTKDNVVSLIKGSERVSFEEASENSSSH